MRRTLMLLMGLLMCTPVVGARDLNRQNYLVGEKASGMGGAFSAMVGDAASLYYNPAGLAGMKRRGLSLSASVYQVHWEHYDKLLDVDVGLRTDMDSQTFSTFPSSVVYTLPLTEMKDPEAFHHVLAVGVIVPDYDKFEHVIDQSIGLYPFELKGSFTGEDMTYWVGAAYAASLFGRLRLGLSVFMLAHLSDLSGNLGMKMAVIDESTLETIYAYSNVSMDRSAISLTMLSQMGLQFDITPNLCVGLTLRSPTFGRFNSYVNMLQLASSHMEDADGNPVVTEELSGYSDRIETDDVTMEKKLPLMIGLGLAYRVPDSWALGLDLRFHLPQDEYLLFSGPSVYPVTPMGEVILDPDRALDADERRQHTWLLNASLGAEVKLSESWSIRAGAFTNFSVVDMDYYDRPDRRLDALLLPRMMSFGASLGLGRRQENSSNSIIITYVYGSGESYSINEIFGLPAAHIEVQAHTLTLSLAGTADF
ncbi:MAG: hypothetical protein JRF33_04955 [Deltaproteobacteria bacterium]|nr:hypothetical protein [Deltaproteobacteria bacterium]